MVPGQPQAAELAGSVEDQRRALEEKGGEEEKGG